MTTKEEIITIDDIEYKLSDLSDECRIEINSLQFNEALVQRLTGELSVAKTALNAYRNAVSATLPTKESKH
tara:strand:+ start:1415 stop:1627 length:213 start_codon:yes stop_codon:yes gene_type:complete